MRHRTCIAWGLALACATLAATAGCDDPKTKLTDLGHSHPKYKPGQVWNYRARPAEEQSTATILRVESHPTLGNIVHVRLDGLRIKNPKAKSGYTDVASHVPFSEKALDDSVTSVVKITGAVPDYMDGYASWRRAHDAGEAGVFTVPVVETVEGMEKGIQGGVQS